jgi:hypothetical protein
MERIKQALDSLGLATEDPENSVKHVEAAIEHLEYALDSIESNMLSEEIVQLLNMLAADSEIETIIYELELLINEM